MHTMSELREVLEEMVSGHLPDQGHFVVEVKISPQGDQTLLSILIDADQGVTIDTCAKVSRAVSNEIEDKNLIENAYRIEVSSPGVDYPLASERQYIKNIGRELKVLLQDGKEVKGKLLTVADGSITLQVKKKEKGKKATEEETSHALEDIKKSIVQVSFK
ncbi:ribosome maturation factor RimP [Algoriphagus hitonicola]|uniref:Ribosome maturation factor RimP n=2 Tax=Algoriphagus hitonicola TaxID=435880 RepID=A0A1I2RZM2_9BACT|nr:ribosome maturation factor RimP [Algoriphagus hitonicola]